MGTGNQKGEPYLSISLNGEHYVAFANEWKKKDKHPDWRIFQNDQAEGQSQRKKGMAQASLMTTYHSESRRADRCRWRNGKC